MHKLMTVHLRDPACTKIQIEKNYLISEEDAIITVLGVDPRVADKVHLALAGYALKSECLEEEFGVVVVFDNDSTRDSMALVPFEVYFELRLACCHR
jgi:hypothetical protein